MTVVRWWEHKREQEPNNRGSFLCHCCRCGYDWMARVEKPSSCSRCGSDRWYLPRGTPLVPTFPCLCLRCNHQWNARTPRPAKCPSCSQFLWYTPRAVRSRDLFEGLAWKETDECIVWPRGCFNDGYGKIRVGKKTVKTHRLAYETRIGQIPEGMKICHICDNPPCMNYRHIFVGTVRENNEDKRLKERHAHGEKHPLSKLTETDVIEIRAKYVRDVKNRAKRQLWMAEEYGVEQTTISAIIRRKTWKHLK